MNNIWLIGSGEMSQDYARILEGLDKEYLVIGRGENSAKIFKKETNHDVIIGGLEAYLASMPKMCSHAIISVGVEALYKTTKSLLEYGVKNILVEKPGAMLIEEFDDLVNLTEDSDANVLVAYNRRFYASVLEAEKIIKKDGGVMSFNFEFTEWSHIIEPIQKGAGVKEKWFLANSTHVVDLAFFLGGKPKEISTYTTGKINWHQSASTFSGAGMSELGALFSYKANWLSAGRWSIEVLTSENKLIFSPMEKLQIQKRGSIKESYLDNIDYSLDEKYKPGLFLQTRNFLNGETDRLCTILEQKNMASLYNQMSNY
jgi:predicted dehydrogenase